MLQCCSGPGPMYLTTPAQSRYTHKFTRLLGSLSAGRVCLRVYILLPHELLVKESECVIGRQFIPKYIFKRIASLVLAARKRAVAAALVKLVDLIDKIPTRFVCALRGL